MESESLTERSKRTSWNVDFNVVRVPYTLLGPINYGKYVCFFNSVVQVLYYLPIFRDYINKLRTLVKGVAMKIRNVFSEIQASSASMRTSNYIRYLVLQHYEPGMQYDAHINACYSCLQKFTLTLMTSCLRLIN